MIKATPPFFDSFWGPIFNYAVARWAFEDGLEFLEVGLLDGSYLDVVFLHPVHDVV